MSSYRQILYHIIFRTKNSINTLSLNHSHILFVYIIDIIKKKRCHLYRINGIENHIHILNNLHPSFSLANYMREMKTSSSIWVKQQKEFQLFNGWADGYAALTYSYKEKKPLSIPLKTNNNITVKFLLKKNFVIFLNLKVFI